MAVTNMQEKWAKLVYPNIPDDLNRFEISTHGRLKNVKTQYIYKHGILRNGYCSVRTTLGSRDNKVNIIIHRAVAYTFLDNPNCLPEVNHKDGNKENNHIDNLEWCTSQENQQHKCDTGLFDKRKVSGENNANAKLTWDDVRYIRENYIPYSREYGARAMAKKFGVHKTRILLILNNKSWIEDNIA